MCTFFISIEITHTHLLAQGIVLLIALQNKVLILETFEVFQLFFASNIQYKLIFLFIHFVHNVLNHDCVTSEHLKMWYQIQTEYLILSLLAIICQSKTVARKGGIGRRALFKCSV